MHEEATVPDRGVRAKAGEAPTYNRAHRTMIGTKVSHYRVLEQLGAGGMGIVYLARDDQLARNVALKFIVAADADVAGARERLLREARSASALDHPNVATVYEVGEWNGQLFLAMGYYAGETLDARIARGPLSVTEAVAIAEQIAAGLAAAHAAGITHRDLKPANVIVTSGGLVKILDFGLAKAVGPNAETEVLLTRPGAVAGTVAYMAPEQARGGPVDQRVDIWAFGVVLFEMLTGRRPFQGTSAAAMLSAIASDPVPAIRSIRHDAPAALDDLVHRAVVKDPGARTLTAEEAAAVLAAERQRLSGRAAPPRRKAIVSLVIAVAVLLVVAGIATKQSLDRRWVNRTALPELSTLVAAQDLGAAIDLATRIERYAPSQPELVRVWPAISRPFSIDSQPAGAEVFYRQYGRTDAWRRAGRTPLDQARLPMGWVQVRLEAPGAETVEDLVANFVGAGSMSSLNVLLPSAGSAPAGMVRAGATPAPFSVYVQGLELPRISLDAYWIDREEVTNAEFQQFVDAGGYSKPEFWDHPIVKDGRAMTWEEARAVFRDATGQPGPAGWEMGRFPVGQDALPVAGVSWYEAMAYARFAGKSLPTVYHWSWVATQPLAGFVIPHGTFNARVPQRADTARAVHRFGAVNMAGNLKEWTINESRQGKRYILGGGYDEPPYMFSDPDARDPIERAANFGFRCVRLDTTADARQLAAIPGPSRHFDNERPVSDEIFAVYARNYDYDRTPLDAVVESTDDSHADWRVEKVTFAAGYPRERVIAWVYLPRRVAPPYQTVVFVPPATAWDVRSSAAFRANAVFGFLVRSGRALVFPIYRGTFERGTDDFKSDYPKNTTAWRDHVIGLSRDFRRTVDYLLTRPDVDPARIGMYGVSRGAALGPQMLALEPRVTAAALWLGGFYQEPLEPDADALHFAPRVRAATLMLSGRYDYNFPEETSSLPMFNLLGTPPQHKKRMRYDTGHNLPVNEAIKETLSWFDHYFGIPK